MKKLNMWFLATFVASACFMSCPAYGMPSDEYQDIEPEDLPGVVVSSNCLLPEIAVEYTE